MRPALFAIGLLALFIGIPPVKASAGQNCDSFRSLDMAASFSDFDQGERWWRESFDAACYSVALRDIDNYIKLNHSRLSESELSILNWHAGQILAYQENYADAVIRFQQTVSASEADEYYKQATISFLRRDHAALIKSLHGLETSKPPIDFQEAARAYEQESGRKITWPPNLSIVQHLVECFNENYRKAYEGSCRPN